MREDPETIQAAFGAIAGRYDCANHALSGGWDFLWRARAAAEIAAARPQKILDLATGSGDLAMAIRRRCPGSQVVGADFCVPMLRQAEAKGVVGLVCADGLALPFADGVFGAVTISFGLRNMASWDGGLREMARVLEPGGLLLVMDFGMPRSRIVRSLYRLYLHHVLPHLAGWLTGRPEAYRYLADSIEAFPRDAAMLALMEGCGFAQARSVLLPPGVAAFYTARRRPPPNSPLPSDTLPG